MKSRQRKPQGKNIFLLFCSPLIAKFFITWIMLDSWPCSYFTSCPIGITKASVGSMNTEGHNPTCKGERERRGMAVLFFPIPGSRNSCT